MGYIIGLLLLIVVVPLLFMLLSRRTAGSGGMGGKGRSRGVTVSEPSSDQPTPRANETNRAGPEVERRLPPG